MTARVALLALALAATGCYGSLTTDGPQFEPTADGPAPDAGPLSYRDDIAPLFATMCAGCHSGAAPIAGYDTSSFPGLMGGGSDGTPNVVPGDAQSKLVVYLAPPPGKDHQGFDASFPGVGQIVADWVAAGAPELPPPP